MTISNQVAKSPLYSGNGVTTAFSTTFPFQNNSDLGVYRLVISTGTQTKLVLNVDYTVSGAGSPSGGTVTIGTPPTTDHKIRIVREAPYTQEADYQEGTNFPAETHEGALDKATMLIQQVKEAVERSPQLAVTSTTYPLTFPSGGVSEAGKVITWASPNGDSLVNKLSSDLDLSLTGGEAITISGHYTFDLDIGKQSQIGSVDKNADYMLIRDATDSTVKKVLVRDLPIGTEAITGGAAISVDGSNQISLDIQKQSTGTVNRSNDYFVFYNASTSSYRRATPASFSISAISQDTTPTLGGDLATNGKKITGSPIIVDTTGGTKTAQIRTNSLAIGDGASPTATSATTTAFGHNALNKAVGAAGCTAIGQNALAAATSGSYNTAIGQDAMSMITTGSYNTGLGPFTLASLVSGTGNLAMGPSGSSLITTGSYNTGLGYNALANVVVGGENVGIGRNAGPASDGSNTISIGSLSSADVATGSTSADHGPGIAIGAAARPVGFRGNGTIYPSAGASAGYLRIKINGTVYKIQLYADS